MTAQIPDTILIDGQAHELFSEPLNAYYSDAPRPNFIPQSTANWRGYIGTWEVRDGRLYLIGVAAEICNLPLIWDCPKDQRRKVGLVDLFPQQGGAILADWFSGTLRVPIGGQLQYRHMGYESVYEFDLLLTIEKGAVKSTTTVDNRKTRK